MENTKKPSSLYIVQHHHELENFQKSNSILLRPEMLKWNLYGFDSEEPLYKKNIDLEMIYRVAIEGLCNIGPFEAAISLQADEQNERLYLVKRTWGKIFIGGTPVLTFSHHTSKENYAFSGLTQWPELECENVQEILRRWSDKDWAEFFRSRIHRRANELIKKADAKRKDAKGYEESALLLLNNLI